MSNPITSEANAMVDLECRLTISVRRDCDCAPYFIRRRSVLIPAVLTRADERGIDPVDLFAKFARGVHARHEAGLSLAVSA